VSTLRIPVGPEDHAEGPVDAPVTLVEYGDYECPHCSVAFAIVPRVQKHFGERLRFVFRNFPLTKIHPEAEPAAETAEYAGSLGKFWPMHDQLFENQVELGQALYQELATNLDLDPAALSQALESGTFTQRVQADFSGGVRSGVNGTPTFFINGERHNGPFDYDTLVAAIEAALANA